MFVHSNTRRTTSYTPNTKKETKRVAGLSPNDIEETDGEGEDDDGEMVGLINGGVNSKMKKTSSKNNNNKVLKNDPPSLILMRIMKILVMIIAVLSFFTAILCFYARSQGKIQQKKPSSIGGSNNLPLENTLNIQCPVPLDSNVGDDDIDVGSFLQQGKTLRTMDTDEIWHKMMKDGCIDSWDADYDKFKQRIHVFKEQTYNPYFETLVEDDDIGGGETNIIRIYESACGVGRDIVLTLDLALNEIAAAATSSDEATTNDSVKSKKTIVEVYGNDYTSDSAAAARTIFKSANDLFNRDIIKKQSKDIPKIQLGSICGGVDSTDLRHVPSDSMDISYTGYVAPLHDPLKLQETDYPNTTRKEISNVYTELCSQSNATDTENYDPTAKHQTDLMQSIQDDYFAKWVGEMIRIAKPGALVVCEQIPRPKCVKASDLGGVSKQFWLDATQNERYRRDYHWDQIDPASIKFTATVYSNGKERHSERYHVAMKKKGKDEMRN